MKINIVTVSFDKSLFFFLLLAHLSAFTSVCSWSVNFLPVSPAVLSINPSATVFFFSHYSSLTHWFLHLLNYHSFSHHSCNVCDSDSWSIGTLHSRPTWWLLCLFHSFPKSLQTCGLVHNLKQGVNTSPTSFSIHSLMYICISKNLIRLHWVSDFIHCPMFENKIILETRYVTNLSCEGDGLMTTICTALLYWLEPTEWGFHQPFIC